MRLLDTDILIDIQRGYQPAVDWFASLDDMPGVPGFIVMELFQDVPNARRLREVEDLVAPLEVVWPSEGDCQRALTDFRALHLSHGLGLLDTLISATTIGRGATLVTFNARHFFPVAGLTTEQPYPRQLEGKASEKATWEKLEDPLRLTAL